MDYRDKVAYVTGGSSGIGLAIARELAGLGAHVWLIARRQNLLEEALQAVSGASRDPKQRFGTLALDVSDPVQVAARLPELIASTGTPDLVINSAGVARPGYFEELPLEVFQEMMAINYFGTVHVTRTIIPGMVQRGSGTVVNFSSIAGFLGVFGYTAYGASKYAVRGFSDTLRAEMKPKGIQVSVVFPPDTKTPQLEYEDQFKPPETREISGTAGLLSPEQVAHTVLKDVARGRYVILPGFESKLYYHIINLAGNLTYPVMDMMIAQAIKKTRSKMGSKNTVH